ncbi:ribonuclease H [Senna tora]|uniref:Ribonuclease H n=1 Tax=Senna tora TaxID=362788 RepID=A0A834THP7_9FABA|nr:ribonuclease H [Senna tora]
MIPYGCQQNIKLNLGNPGSFAIGGVIRDHMGNWVKGFSGFVGQGTVLQAELWAIFSGLHFRNLVKLDCLTPSEKEASVLIFLLSSLF